MVASMPTSTHQSGFVSLFSVIFFMLFITVLTIGFVRIMGIEQRQALDNDLSASAYAAAQSGLEDGKRAILRYYDLAANDPSNPLRTQLRNALTSSDCNALTGTPSIVTALGLNAAGSVTGNTQLEQYYTCLTVNLNSPDYIHSKPAGESDYVPLRTTSGNFDQIKVSWHLLSSTVGVEGDGVPANYVPTSTSLPPLVNVTGTPANSWTTQRYPAYLRVQLYGYPNGNINRADLEARSRTFLLIPSGSVNPGSIADTTPINFETADPRGVDQTKDIVKPIRCINSPSSNIGAYACSATLAMPIGPLVSSNNNYFLRVTPIYGQSHFRLALVDSGSATDFSEVQPIVDVTGRANDVFRRIQARVRINPPGSLPEFGVESADTICKNMRIADSSFYTANNCP